MPLFQTLQFPECLQPDIESINLAWNKFEMTLDRVEFDLQQFLHQYQTIKTTLENDLDLLERDIANIERSTAIKVRSFVRLIELSHYLSFSVTTFRSHINQSSIE